MVRRRDENVILLLEDSPAVGNVPFECERVRSPKTIRHFHYAALREEKKPLFSTKNRSLTAKSLCHLLTPCCVVRLSNN